MFSPLSRRTFLRVTPLGLTALTLMPPLRGGASAAESVLLSGRAPAALETPWFPSRLHAFVWRNWGIVAPEGMAAVVGGKAADIVAMGRSMGLEAPQFPAEKVEGRYHLTVIRRNWHLLPYEQLLTLLDWDAPRLARTLREDDFLFVKLGSLKPQCSPLRWAPPTDAASARAAEIAELVRGSFPRGKLEGVDAPYSFQATLKTTPAPAAPLAAAATASGPWRMGYSYFALCGDPLLDATLDPYPDALPARLAAAGENAVWLHVELSNLAPLPWLPDPHIAARLSALRTLTARAARHGIGIFLYLNEPRALPTASAYFTEHPEVRGVEEAGYRALCTSDPGIRAALRDAVASLCREVPDLGGIFTITASENFTSCWSHGHGVACPRCAPIGAAAVIADVSGLICEGIRASGGGQRYFAWDWGWPDTVAEEIIARLPSETTLLSVSEWSLPIERGGVKSTVGEYSISAIGPGPRATRHWAAAKKRGLRVAAKIQCGNTWELAAVPWIPVVDNIARHAAALRDAGVTEIMLGWTLGGHPSPNLEAVREVMSGGTLDTLAKRLHGAEVAAPVAAFWRECSAAFGEFPYHIGVVYNAPLQAGPANPLWPAPTGYTATMVGIGYDDLTTWRAVYPPDVFAAQLDKVAGGFEHAVATLRAGVPDPAPAVTEDLLFAEAAAIHFASVACQARAVTARDTGNTAALRQEIAREKTLAIRLHALRSRDSRIGFEASNQYFYTPLDLVEKVINCAWMESRSPHEKP